MKKSILFLLSISLIVGCSERDLGPIGFGNDLPDTDVYVSKDSRNDQVNPRNDVIRDASDTQACPVSKSVFGNIFSIDPTGPDKQIHAAAAWDGTGIWVVYNRPDSAKKFGFDVWAVRLGCDGTHLIKPFMVNHESMDNNTYPTLAVNGDVVMFAWQADNGQAPNNLSIWYRSFNTDGSQLMAADHVLDMSGDITKGQNAWMVGLAALPGSDFVLVGSAGAKGFKEFQVLMQKLDKKGVNIGPGFLCAPEKGVSQVWPAVASDMKRNIYVAWERDQYDQATGKTDYGVRIARISIKNMAAAGPGNVFDPYPGKQNKAPAYASAEPGGPPWMAFQTKGNSATHIMVRNGQDFFAPSEMVPDSSGMNHTPAIVSVPYGGAIVWYRLISGIKNEVWFQEFKQGLYGNPVMSGKPIQVNKNPAAPYAPAIAALPNGYFIAWSEGKSSEFRINGVFVHRTK